MAFEIVGFQSATRNEGASVENIFGRTFETEQEARDFIKKEGRTTDIRFFGQKFGYSNAEIRQTETPTTKTYTTNPLSASAEAERRDSRARLERRQAGISFEEEKLLKNLDKAERSGDISKQSASELRYNIVNRDELAAYATARRTENTRNEIATSLFNRQADLAQQRIQASPIGTSGGQLLKMLPDQFRTPESTRSIGEFNYNRQLATAPLTTLGRPSLIGSDEFSNSVAARSGSDLILDKGFSFTSFGYQVQPLYSDKGFSSRDGSGSTGQVISTNNLDVNSNRDRLLGLQKEEGFFKRTSKAYGKELVNIPVSLSIGIGKLFYSPNYIGGNPLINIGQDKYLRTKGSLISDKDVKGALFGVGLVGVDAISAPIALGSIGVLTGVQSYNVAKNPSAENIGSFGAQLTYLAAVPFASKFSKSSRASKAFDIIENAKSKGTFPEMRILQSPSIKTIKVERKTSDIFRDLGTGSEIVKPSNLVTSKYKYDIIKQGVSTGYGKKGKITTSLVSTPIEQFSVIKIDRPIGNPLFIRSTTRGGTTTTKVFSGDKLLKVYEAPAVPDLVFTSARPIATARARDSRYDLRQDIRKKYTTQRGVSNVFSKKYQAFGQSLGIEATKLTTRTKSQASTSNYQKFIDLDLQSGGLEFGGYNPIRTKYIYTKYPVQEKPFVKEFSAEGGIFVSKPTESFTRQRSFAKRVFQISYGKPVKNVPFVEKKQKPLVSKTLIELQTIYGKEKKARTPKGSASQFSVAKSETINLVKIQTARVKNYLFKSDFKVFSPVKVATKTANRGLVLGSGLGLKSQTRQRKRTEKVIDTSSMSKQGSILKNSVKVNVATRNMVVQKNLQSQSQKQFQQQRNLTRQINIQTNINTNPSFNPKFGFTTPKTPFTPKTPKLFTWDWQSKGGKKSKSIFNVNSPFSGKYTASVGAVLFNIRGKRPRREEYSTGLTVRPLEV